MSFSVLYVIIEGDVAIVVKRVRQQGRRDVGYDDQQAVQGPRRCLRPSPRRIEHAEPGGGSCTIRIVSLTGVS